jgi:hypothetical protein
MPFTTGWALGGHLLRVENQVWARVREEEQFLAIESQRFGQPGNDPFGRAPPLARFQVADVRRRSLDAVRDLLLRQIEQASS